MMVISLFLVCLFKSQLVVGSGGGYGADWNYVEGVVGPPNWSNNYSYCGGNKQSPINILTSDATYNKDLGLLKLLNYSDTDTSSFEMKNSNSALTFKAEGAPEVPLAVVFKGTTYRLYQFHFHWGLKSFRGSEHQVDSQQYAGEMHIIHYNTKYPNVTEAIDKEDGLLVWGHLLKVGSNNNVENTDFQSLLALFTDAEQCCTTKSVPLKLKKLLPSKHDQFYTYRGSLTTPPCYESVRWIVSRHPILVSENQMKKFRALKDVVMGQQLNKALQIHLVDNYRPVQALGSRSVESNFDPSSDDVCATGVSVKPFTAIIFTMVVTFIFAM